VSSAAATSRRRQGLTLQQKEARDAYLCLMPFLLGFVIFTAGPILLSLYLSFTRYNIVKPAVFIGLGNYRKMFASDPLFWLSLGVTVKYTVLAVPAQVVTGYVLALLLNRKLIGLSIWRSMLYLPAVVPAMATAYLFFWLLQTDLGIVNQTLRSVGVRGPAWFGDPDWVLVAFVIMSLWGVGSSLVLYLAALQGVPTSLYDAAKVDGANVWHELRHITLPMTSPVIFFTFVTGLIGTFQIFTSAFLTTDGGPANSSLFYVLYLYRNGWLFVKMGYAAAMAWFMCLLLLVLTFFSLRIGQRVVFYEGVEAN